MRCIQRRSIVRQTGIVVVLNRYLIQYMTSLGNAPAGAVGRTFRLAFQNYRETARGRLRRNGLLGSNRRYSCYRYSGECGQLYLRVCDMTTGPHSRLHRESEGER